MGQNLAVRLQTLGYEVSVLGRNLIKGEQMKAQGMQFLPVDLGDRDATVAACLGQDYIFHCAALSSPWGKYQAFYQANVIGTRNIIQGCETHPVRRLIHVSTPSVYFEFCDRLNIPETRPLPAKPVNAYAHTKRQAEEELNKAYQDGLPVISIRPRGIFGPGDSAIFPRLIRANQKLGIPLINQGKACIDMTYIDNVVDALILCQNAPDHLLGRTFNITNGEPTQLIDLLKQLFTKLDLPLKLKPISYRAADWTASAMELLAKTLGLGAEPLLTRYTVGVLSFSQTLDITSAQTELGYTPKITLEEGLDIFAKDWIRNHPSGLPI